MVRPPNDLRKFESFIEIVEALRGPQGCPWDKEQTHRTLTPYAIEEAHELAEAIEQGDRNEIVSELGDLLLQVVLHAEIGRQEGHFDIHDVIEAVSSKMVRRHPHVFSDASVKDSDEVLKNWAQLKELEKAGKPKTAQTRFDVPLALPSLARSHKIGDKTRKVRFDWSSAIDVLAKVDEELAELKTEMKAPSPDRGAIEHELGDLLFSVAQLARHLGLESEQCLRTTNARFEHRFFTMKTRIEASGRTMDALSTDELENEWRSAKAALASHERSKESKT